MMRELTKVNGIDFIIMIIKLLRLKVVMMKVMLI